MSLCLFFCGGLLTPAGAQSYLIRTYSEDDGLPSSQVLDVAQAPDGRMWFGTRNGVCVYDGAVWRTFGPADGIPSTNIFRLSLEDDGTVWAMSDSLGTVYLFDGDRWSALPRLTGQQWRAEDFTDFEVASFAGVATPLLATRRGLVVYRERAWRQLPTEQAISSLASDDTGAFVGTAAGLFRFEPSTLELKPAAVRPPPGPVSALAAEGSHLWAAGGSWVGRLQDGEWALLATDLQPLSDSPGWVQLEPDGHGGAYVADREMITHVTEQGEQTRFGETSGLIGNGATGLHFARQDILWVINTRGASKLVSRRFATYRRAHGLLEDEVTAILEMSQGDLILGHNRGLTRLDAGRPTDTFAFPMGDQEALSHGRVMDLARSPDGVVWAVTNYRGVWRLPPGPLEQAENYSADHGLDRHLASLAFDHEGQLWVAGQGLFRLDGDRFVPVEVQLASDRPIGTIRRLDVGPRGTLYMATTHEGLVTLRDGEWQIYKGADEKTPSLFTVLATADGQVWIGAEDGLYELSGGRIVPASELRLQRPVYSLLEDSENRLWVGTDYGVHRVGEQRRYFGIREGLAGHETNRAAAWIDSGGKVWIGTDLGVSRYDEAYDIEPEAPSPSLLGVEAGGQLLPASELLDLPWNHNNLVFRFRALSFIDEDAIEYSGKLEGFDQTFLSPERAVARQITYTNLAPGNYRFVLRARTAGGPWSQPVRSALIRIDRPFWRTFWFFGLAGGTLLLAAAGATQHVAARRHSRHLAAQVRERTAELQTTNRQLSDQIAERERTEAELREAKSAAEEASRAKSRFLAVMSHEIRTPMTGVLGTIDLLEAGGLTEDQSRHTDTLRRSGKALLAILDDILDYSQIEADQLDIERRPFAIREVIENVVVLFAARAVEKGVVLSSKLDPALPRRVMGDSSRLRQVISNLVGNAVKFTDAGSVEVVCRWHEGSEGRLEIEVRDTGIGIPRQRMDGLFKPFHMVDASSRRRHGGTGLGLAISRRLVTAMGGEVRVTSRLGEGSTFTVLLPLEAAPEPPVTAPRDAPSPPRADGARPLRILVAEDNLMVQKITLNMLRALGYRADLAENGLEVLEALESTAYDLILMDIQMPRLDGLEATRRIVARLGGQRPIIIAMTAHALRGDREMCLEAGMDDYLAKPVTLRVLADSLAAWADRRPLREA